MKEYKSYFRSVVDAMAGYAPGEQPKMLDLVKLNTNENPFPPSPAVLGALETFDGAMLRRYPDPMADSLCAAIAEVNNVSRNMVIAGNGSDDILTMTFRAFTAPDKPVAIMEPTYSLYPVLASMQEAPVIKIALQEDKNFAMPCDVLEQAAGANLLIITRPNAPTGNTFPKEDIRKIASEFDGIVFIDEAYADFAEDNCMDLVHDFANVIVSRTSSKSLALAGLRFGYAVANPVIIEGLNKLKDSYNMDMITQKLAEAAIRDQEYLQTTLAKVKALRADLAVELEKLNFKLIPSQANFIFAAPPDNDGAKAFKFLREHAVIVRYFPGEVTGKYLRITVGTAVQNKRLTDVLKELYK
ncbi:MAG: histidinol-phosphate transaminase [Lentisphaerae bacterium]|nr:histidinol-phosphate transaminase [Lentisphaerota bacterium]